jgi:antibiotic biosynthesis monooxygenase (ABM) superfamily enzyme
MGQPMPKTIAQSGAKETASLLVVRKIKAGCEEKFWQLEDDIQADVSQFKGFVAVSHMPTDGENEREYFSIVQFDSAENLIEWERSELRKHHLQRIDELLEGEIRPRRVSGLEDLFRSEDKPAGPARYKMVIVLIVVIFSMLAVLRPLSVWLFGDLNDVVRTLLVVATQVPLMTYFVMPFLTRLLGGWLKSS